MPDVITTNYEALMAACWELQFEQLSHEERRERLGIPDLEYRRLRGEAMVTFEPTAEHIHRVLSRAPKEA